MTLPGSISHLANTYGSVAETGDGAAVDALFLRCLGAFLNSCRSLLPRAEERRQGVEPQGHQHQGLEPEQHVAACRKTSKHGPGDVGAERPARLRSSTERHGKDHTREEDR